MSLSNVFRKRELIMGRDAYSRRGVLEYSYGISIADIAASGLFKHAQVTGKWDGTISRDTGWGYREPVAVYTALLSITPQRLVESEVRNPHLAEDSFIQFDVDHQGNHFTKKHRLERQPVHLGGQRWYFKCAGCGRRCKALYFCLPAFACRCCARLVYRSSREHRNSQDLRNAAWVAYRKADNLRARKHPRLANRELWKALELERLYDQTVFFPKIQAIEKRYFGAS